MIEVVPLTVNEAAAFDPKLTAVTPVKLVPIMVTLVPARRWPSGGSDCSDSWSTWERIHRKSRDPVRTAFGKPDRAVRTGRYSHRLGGVGVGYRIFSKNSAGANSANRRGSHVAALTGIGRRNAIALGEPERPVGPGGNAQPPLLEIQAAIARDASSSRDPAICPGPVSEPQRTIGTGRNHIRLAKPLLVTWYSVTVPAVVIRPMKGKRQNGNSKHSSFLFVPSKRTTARHVIRRQYH